MINPGEASRIAQSYQATIPVDVFALASVLGLGPRIDDTLPEDISGAIQQLANGEWEIVVNGSHSLLRQRFTIAHEIAHFIYHRNRLEQGGGGTSDTLAYRSDNKISPNKLITWLQEYQANQYASNLLVPQAELDRLRNLPDWDEARLADHFKVSRAAMNIKLGRTPGRA